MAQTTCLASFGAVYVASAATNPLTCLDSQYNLNRIYNISQVDEESEGEVGATRIEYGRKTSQQQYAL